MTGEALASVPATLPTPNSTTSFWHSKPSPTLIGHRTTAHLPTKADVVIIGSGIAGAFAAHYVAADERGSKLDVVMLEAREACWGATGRNGGHYQPLLYRNPPHIGRFELANFDNVRSLVTDNDIECEWQDVEGCHAYGSASMFAAQITAIEVLRSLDPELGKMIHVVMPESKNPSLTDLRLGENIVGAIIQKMAASLSPYKLVAWILERLLSANSAGRAGRKENSGSFNLQTSTPVNRLQLLEDGGWILHTLRGMLAVKQVLLATNAYTSHLLHEFSDLIVPVRGEVSALIPSPAMRPGVGKPLTGRNSYCFYGRGIGNFSQDDYLVQRPFSKKKQDKHAGGELMFGGGREYAPGLGIGISNDGDIDQHTADYLRQQLYRVLDLHNSGSELKASYEWSGIMGFSRDGRPWVGQVPKELGGGEGLWICAGFTGHGMPNASLCAKAVVGAMMEKQISDACLPREYHVSLERVEKARAMVEMQLADILDEI